MSASAVIPSQFVKDVTDRLQQNKRVRRALPGWGGVRIDRQLPFLCVYRQRPEQINQDIHELLLGQASYIMALSGAGVQPQVSGDWTTCALD